MARPPAIAGAAAHPFRLQAVALVMLAFGGIWLGGCAGETKKPFAADIEALDETSPQSPARIRLGPPQVYTREQLINDRLREEGFLKAQLDKSASSPLGSDMARDVSTLAALQAQLGLRLDPASKLNFERQNQQADVQQQIGLTQLQTQLLLAQQQLQALQATPATTAPAAPPATQAAPTVASGTSPPSLDARIQALQTTMTALAGLEATTRAAAVQGTLADDFDGRVALRARIRNAINSNSLDDAHDLLGNALYHLQFNVTILPGSNKRQFGVASLTMEPPKLQDKDFELLYNTWLSSVTNRLNQDLGQPKSDGRTAISYHTLGPMTGLYDVVHFRLRRETFDQCTRRKKAAIGRTAPEDALILAVRPGHRVHFDFCGDKRPAFNAIADALRSGGALRNDCLGAIQANAGTDPLDKACRLTNSGAGQFAGAEELAAFARLIIEIAPSVESGIYALGDRSNIPEHLKQRAGEQLRVFAQALDDSRTVLSAMGAGDDPDALMRAARKAPPTFCKALLDDPKADCGAPGDMASARVRVFPYSTDPIVRTQRISTVASAANAMELAFGAAAQVPGSGIGIDAGLSKARRAAGRVDTIQQVPEVIGFASPLPGQATYEFGWLFGPAVVLDAEGAHLGSRQRPRSVPVSADISVPSWWPGATLKVKVAWRGDFSDPSGGMVVDATEGATAYELPVRFRVNRASLDALTVQLSRALTSQGFHQARIDKVQPTTVTLCEGSGPQNLSFLIHGADLWRNPVVHLGGGQAGTAQVSVLPDMAGLQATIDLSTIGRFSTLTELPLVVWTANGAAETTIKVQRAGSCTPKS